MFDTLPGDPGYEFAQGRIAAAFKPKSHPDRARISDLEEQVSALTVRLEDERLVIGAQRAKIMALRLRIIELEGGR